MTARRTSRRPARTVEMTARPPRHPHAERLGKWAATLIVGSLVVSIVAVFVIVVRWAFLALW